MHDYNQTLNFLKYALTYQMYLVTRHVSMQQMNFRNFYLFGNFRNYFKPSFVRCNEVPNNYMMDSHGIFKPICSFDKGYKYDKFKTPIKVTF